MDSWRVIHFERCDPFVNMAVDEAIFRAARRRQRPPTLRFYGWEKSAVSLGYFQDADAEIHCEYCREKGIDIVRRPTGGKAVLHGDDLTYSVVARENNPLFTPDIVETYRTISACIIKGLEKSGVAAGMEEKGRHGDGSSKAFCFAASYKNELLADGKKICGSAQVRAKGVFLQHGSLLIDFDPLAVCAAIITKNTAIGAESLKKSVSSIRSSLGDNIDMEHLCGNIAAGFEEVLNIRLVEGELSPEEESIRDTLLQNKYLNPRWNTGRGAKSGL